MGLSLMVVSRELVPAPINNAYKELANISIVRRPALPWLVGRGLAPRPALPHLVC